MAAVSIATAPYRKKPALRPLVLLAPEQADLRKSYLGKGEGLQEPPRFAPASHPGFGSWVPTGKPMNLLCKEVTGLRCGLGLLRGLLEWKQTDRLRTDRSEQPQSYQRYSVRNFFSMESTFLTA